MKGESPTMIALSAASTVAAIFVAQSGTGYTAELLDRQRKVRCFSEEDSERTGRILSLSEAVLALLPHPFARLIWARKVVLCESVDVRELVFFVARKHLARGGVYHSYRHAELSGLPQGREAPSLAEIGNEKAELVAAMRGAKYGDVLAGLFRDRVSSAALILGSGSMGFAATLRIIERCFQRRRLV
jgi:hypothetical protein